MQTKTLLLALFAAATAAATTIPARAANAALFGSCNPAMDFQFGRPGRKATEGTFLPVDPTVAKGQSDALNPNIITNAICNNLVNDCGVAKDSEGETKCLAAKAVVAALTTKDATTADAFNNALGVSA
ncbi:uncharacterized protein K444DRAFT_639688 [Hyaloscypha bicolor E]|jgi:hypothetical protein|uniref:Uncharacterized protein n=1 Tax=Hyaloscypha bicolor E TaxID=1095630 RepID=A0A2J6TU89_9HELO|nr:uncharacterized protein K444DRAFT_639688 [Hyaloscypha bicolor E]PMD66566.1 hypothetical protein K444DRAFT_639688 [Hyaloscypha bicolor E]